MPRAARVCSCRGCPQHTGPCPTVTRASRCVGCAREAETRRGTATARGYNSRGHRGFRLQVLDRDPICVLCHLAASTVADHWPVSRRDLAAAGRDPDDPNAGRGLCKTCHDQETARNQPGGWANRT